MTTLTTALVIAAVLIAVIAVSVTIREKRLPLDVRLERVRTELRSSETATGSASILSGYMIGVSDDMVKDLAISEGYEWTGYTGQNRRRLNFQRVLPSVENGK